MKKIYVPVITLLFFSIMISFMVSCKKNGFLTPTSISNLNQASVFKDSINTNLFLANIYSQIGVDVNGNEFGNGGIDAAGDESQASNASATDANDWASGTINPTITTNNVYNTCYTQIRAVNVLLANIHNTRLTLPSTSPGSREQLKAEARFLRAWYYFILLRHYGGVNLVGDRIYNYNDAIPTKRNTFEQCVNYITSECDSMAQILPPQQTNNFYGRATQGACLALKARVLLYAASPLFNGTTLVHDAGQPTNFGPYQALHPTFTADSLNMLYGYPTYDVNRWKLAADAAQLIISSTYYALWQGSGKNGNGFQSLFCQRGNATKEYILQWMLPSGNYGQQLEAYWDPPTRGGGGGGFPYQETVDVFPMLDGKSISDPTSAYTYNSQNPYVNRDPRLNYTFIHDQTVLPVRLQPGVRTPISIYLINQNGTTTTASADAIGEAGATLTGYYTNKMLDTNSTATALNQQTQRCQPLMRYAEVLLNYAEAENEYAGPDASVYKQLEDIRARAGILKGTDGLYGLKAGMTQDEMRTAIQLERRLELAYEGFRFWDVRRWKIAGTEENKQFHGMKVVRTITGSNTVTSYTTFPLLPVHNFANRMYLWPFPESEVQKTKDLLQNPGY